MWAELQAAAEGADPIEDSVLEGWYGVIADAQYERPGEDPLPGVRWSALYRAYYEAMAPRESLSAYAVYAARDLAARLDFEGARSEAVAVLEEASATLARDPSAPILSLELGGILRDEQAYIRARTQLTSGLDAVERNREAGRLDEGYSDFYRAQLLAELGSITNALGMSDVAQEQFAEAEQLAQGLDPSFGTDTWGAVQLYQLHRALRHAWGDLEGLERHIQGDPAFESLDPALRAQIELRMAMGRVKRIHAGSLELSVDEEGDPLERALARFAREEQASEDERARAALALAVYHLDRGRLSEAGLELDRGRTILRESTGFETLRMHEAGLRARLLREQGAAPEERARFLDEELAPVFVSYLERVRTWPLEKSGVALISFDWLQAILGQLIDYELALDREGRGPQRALEWLARLQSVGTFARSLELEAPSSEDVAEALLPPGKGLLAYAPGREHSHLFLLDAEGCERMRIAPTHALDRGARELSAELILSLPRATRTLSAQAERRIARASELFLPPAMHARLASWDEVLVVGLDAFGYVPLELLLGPDGRVGSSHAVSYLPSLPVGLWLAQQARSQSGGGAPWIYVAPGEHPGYAPLAVPEDLLGLEAYAHSAGLALERTDLEQQAPGASLVQLICHGLYESERPRPAGLLIDPAGEPAAWFAEEIEARAWPPVVLVSACGAGREKLRAWAEQRL